jgi:DNA-nicking Smr family endonuclease
MAKYFPPDSDDLSFFQEAMRDVKKLARGDVSCIPRQSSASNRVHNLRPEKKAEFTQYSSVLVDPLEQQLTADDKLFFKRSGPQDKILKKLVAGELHKSACLDLHGMSIEHARSAVNDFLLMSREAGYRCVQIIHGKGHLSQAKLKNHVNHWLTQFPWVLAFSSAKPRDGGTGAVYILLGKA